MYSHNLILKEEINIITLINNNEFSVNNDKDI